MSLQLISTGKGPDLILIHGWGISSFVFNKVVPVLSEHFTVHCLDLPGYGENVDVYIDYASLDETVSAIGEVIPAGSHILGWSLGGTIALKYALAYPRRVRSLMCVCATPRFCDDDTEIDEAEKYGCKWPGVSPVFIRAFARNLSPENKDVVCEKFFGMQAMGSPTIRQDIKELRHAMKHNVRPGYEVLAGGLKILESTDLREECEKLQVPLLAMFGENDGIVPDGVGAFWEKNKDAQVKIFKDAAHNPFLSSPDEFARTVITFCDQH